MAVRLQDWEDETIRRVMLVTLDRQRAMMDGEYIFLPSVLEDLTDQGQGTNPTPSTRTLPYSPLSPFRFLHFAVFR